MHRQLIALLFAGVLGFGCSPHGSATLVAKGKGVEVTASELQAKLEKLPPSARSRFASREQKKEFLEDLIRFELLAAEARRQGMESDPEVQAALEKFMVQRLVQRSFHDGSAGATPSDAEISSFYDKHLDAFVKPERVRVSQIFLRADRGSADRGARAAQASKLVARLKLEKAKNPFAFAQLARESSDDLASKSRDGDLGLRTREELKSLWSEEVAAAALALGAGQMSGVIESDRGFHILMLTERQPGTRPALDDVRAQIVTQLSREARAKEFEGFVARLRDEARIEIIEAELDNVAVGASPAANPPKQ